ncbi:uncharacterized protein EHS24_006620 [Apiotrichum porosum]|uniref:Uncharacterized protein n=1 Tax=Apiotrichum porosum TaxID=105984 RepID=A0A427Y1S9_9TREE|nr:uncharacterized protein EHS24_006620 [Apiotrichum porosum]RSH85032.1 hypothetical protein EHS24_006620 [Apiotrichum porosum]
MSQATSKTCFGTNATLAESCCTTANGTWSGKASSCTLAPLSDAFKSCVDAGSSNSTSTVQCTLNADSAGVAALQLGRGSLLAVVARRTGATALNVPGVRSAGAGAASRLAGPSTARPARRTVIIALTGAVQTQASHSHEHGFGVGTPPSMPLCRRLADF